MSLEQSVTALEQRNAELVSEVVRARDAVMGLSNMYTTITLGLAGTEDGQYFTVPGNGAYQKLYQHDGAQAPLIATYPNKSDLTDALTTLNTAMSDHVALPDPHDQYAEISGQTFTGDIAAPKITASTGILFGTDTAAANTLDDYEEGTWTPIITDFGTLTILKADYTKVGNIVHLFAQVQGDSTDTVTIDLTSSINGLPFPSDTSFPTGVGGIVQYYNSHGYGETALADLTNNGYEFQSQTIVVRGTFTFADCVSITLRLTYSTAS